MLNLVPYPVRIREYDGQYVIPSEMTVRVGGECNDSVRHKLRILGFRIRKDQSLPAYCVAIGEPVSRMRNAPDRAEGYYLRVDSGGVIIAGADSDGLFWGLVTLEQLLGDDRACPCASITDYPAFPFRMHHDDISRKQVSTLQDFKRIIRLLSSYKIKYYAPYMEDMLFLKRFPDMGKGRGRLTPNEVKGMRAEAERHNITLLPTYSLIGHQENLLQNPKYRKYAREVFQEPSAYDVRKPELKSFLRKVMAEVCELFPEAPIFHACFDEVIGLTEKEFMDHANWCAAELEKHGKKMMMWVDMLKNHWGLEKLHDLHPNILPVEWQYDDPRIQEAAYADVGVIPHGLAGYGNWCQFLPDFRVGKRNLDRWAGVMRRWDGPGYGSSQWGDNGYENSRDLSWNLFAYNGETSWRGKKAAADFEKRFQTTFYGKPLPALSRTMNDYGTSRKLDPRRLWRLFRNAMPQLVRAVTLDKRLAAKAKLDRSRIDGALTDVQKAKAAAVREAEHLNHFVCALERERNTLDRILFAERIAQGLNGSALKRAAGKQIAELNRVKAVYESTWLQQNKRPNIEVSLAVYDRVAASIEQLALATVTGDAMFHTLDLAGVCNTALADVGGVPLQPALVDGVPFSFAPRDKTHCTLPESGDVHIHFPVTSVGDIHLICAGQTIDQSRKRGNTVVEVQLLHEGRVVFEDNLEAVCHVCDWWAPLGEHMWAGGGMKYVDPKRVSYAFSPGENYGLTHLSGFAVPCVTADEMILRRVAPENFYLFAATIEALQ